jgi:hypothetical protein
VASWLHRWWEQIPSIMFFTTERAVMISIPSKLYFSIFFKTFHFSIQGLQFHCMVMWMESIHSPSMIYMNIQVQFEVVWFGLIKARIDLKISSPLSPKKYSIFGLEMFHNLFFEKKKNLYSKNHFYNYRQYSLYFHLILSRFFFCIQSLNLFQSLFTLISCEIQSNVHFEPILLCIRSLNFCN